MGCDAPRRFVAGMTVGLNGGLRRCCLNWDAAGLSRSLAGCGHCPFGPLLSEPRITLIALMGCDAPRPFVPIVDCNGESWDFGWDFGDFGLIGGGWFWVSPIEGVGGVTAPLGHPLPWDRGCLNRGLG